MVSTSTGYLLHLNLYLYRYVPLLEAEVEFWPVEMEVSVEGFSLAGGWSRRKFSE